MRSFSVGFIYDKLEMLKDLLPRISKIELGPKNILIGFSRPKNCPDLHFFGDIVHDDALGP